MKLPTWHETNAMFHAPSCFFALPKRGARQRQASPVRAQAQPKGGSPPVDKGKSGGKGRAFSATPDSRAPSDRGRRHAPNSFGKGRSGQSTGQRGASSARSQSRQRDRSSSRLRRAIQDARQSFGLPASQAASQASESRDSAEDVRNLHRIQRSQQFNRARRDQSVDSGKDLSLIHISEPTRPY